MPTAFVCNCDLTAGVFINFLRERGYRVPEDISVVGFDNYIHPGFCDVGITTYEVDITEMASKTINNLIKKMNHEYYKHGISIVEGHMVVKDSVRKVISA
jgi:DNA-binding LacI/PurR family transcriptional regulator